MKKFYLFLSALIAFTLSASASIKYLYQQNFEGITDASQTDFCSPTGGNGWFSIISDNAGTSLVFTPSGNDRSCNIFWGQDVVKAAKASTYNVSFGFNAKKWGNNHQTTEYTVISTADRTTVGTSAKNAYNGNYRAKSNDWLFDLTQLDSKNGGKDAASAEGIQNFAVNGDSANIVSLTAGTFYTVNLTIDTIARTVEYEVLKGNDEVKSGRGVYQVPEGVDINASGIYFLGARYNPSQLFDDILVSTKIDEDYANVPTVTLMGINNKQRVYNISFLEGETLHLSYNGDETTAEYGDCDGTYVWSNNPDYNPDNEDAVTDECSNGELVAWTTYNEAVSDKVSTQIDNSIIQLPAATASISQVSPGYSKTYTLTANNDDVAMKPKMFISYTFTPADGGEVIEKEDLSSGATVTLPTKGTLELTTSAFGYGSTTTSLVNDIEYNQTGEYNFATLTDAKIVAAGFSADGNAADKWSDYGRIYSYDKNNFTMKENAETGKVDTVYTKLVYNEIPKFTKKSSEWTDSVIIDRLAFTAKPAVNIHIYKNLGLITEGRKGDDMSGNWITNSYVKVNGLTDNDFVVYSSTGNYGEGSLHPYVNSLDEFLPQDKGNVTTVLKGSEPFPILRMSDCLTNVRILRPVGTVDGISNVSTSENDVNAPVYNLAGVRVSGKNLPAGVYVKNGKKFIVNK